MLISDLIFLTPILGWTLAVPTSCPKLCKICPCVEGAALVRGVFSYPYEAYLGIPYAEKPINELRFKNPEPLHKFPRTLVGEKQKCVQRNIFLWQLQISGSEDCLYMNIYRSTHRASESLPVLVYFPHSNLLYGSGEPRDVAPDWLMDPRNTLQIVLVVVQFRVGFMGYFSTGDQSAPGNLGLKDQKVALQWIKTNIASFSGSPDDITVFGDATVQYQLTQSNIVFQKAIITGSYMFSYFKGKGAMTTLEAANLAKNFARVSGYDGLTNEQLVQQLQNESIHTILEVQGLPHTPFFYPFHSFGPMVEDYLRYEIIPEFRAVPRLERFFKHPPSTTWSLMDHNVTILIGFNQFYGEQMVQSIQNYTQYSVRLSTAEALKFHLNILEDEIVQEVIARYGVENKSEFRIGADEYGRYAEMFTDRFYRQPLWKSIYLYNQLKLHPAQMYVFALNEHSNHNNAEARHLFNTFTYIRKSSQHVVKMVLDFVKTGLGPNEPCIFSREHPSGALCPYVVFNRDVENEDERVVDTDVLDDSEALFWQLNAPLKA